MSTSNNYNFFNFWYNPKLKQDFCFYITKSGKIIKTNFVSETYTENDLSCRREFYLGRFEAKYYPN